LAVFAGIVAWAYSPQASSQFDEAARLPFDDDGVDRTGPERRQSMS
jgi:cbb3-type cytochrome oxidase subunit 3